MTDPNPAADRPKIIGVGLVSLDFVVGTTVRSWAGGTCGNVLAILAHLGWDAWPVARLDNDAAGALTEVALRGRHALQSDTERFLDGGRRATQDNGAAREINLHNRQAGFVGKLLHDLGIRGTRADQCGEGGPGQRLRAAATGAALIDPGRILRRPNPSCVPARKDMETDAVITTGVKQNPRVARGTSWNRRRNPR